MQTNPYQIVSLPANPNAPYTSWYEVGDRHDTLQIPGITMGATVGIRLQPGKRICIVKPIGNKTRTGCLIYFELNANV